MNQTLKVLAAWALFFVLVLYLAQQFQNPNARAAVWKYSDFIAKVQSGEVASVEIKPEERTLFGQTSSGEKFMVVYPEDPKLTSLLIEKKVNIEANPPSRPSFLTQVFFNFGPILLLLLFFLFMMRQTQGGGAGPMAFGKSRARLISGGQPKVTFNDVAGVDEAKEELQEVVDFLKDPKKYQALGAKVPKGVLLVGPPGTGKTLLAKAVAGEAGVAFFSISGSDFVEMFVGVGAARVRDLFEQGKKHAPCIIFIDEIDAVGRQRGAGLGGGHDEREQTLNALLVEMDGFNTTGGLILIAATNRPDVLDPALLRPGRFDRQVVVDRPDLKGREAILKVHARNVKMAEGVDLSVIARRTPGFSGADLANVINEAALLAARRNKPAVEILELEEAIDRVMAGPERRSRVLSDREKTIVAYHESGHAIVAKLSPGADPVHRVSIIPRGHAALGYTLQVPEEDRFLTSKSELLGRIRTLLGGRAAEELVFKDVTTGAGDDLGKATRIARAMICEYGMSERLGALNLHRSDEAVFIGRDLLKEKNYSEQTAKLIDQEVKRLVEQCHKEALALLKKHRKHLETMAKTLLEVEVLDAAQVEAILSGKKPKIPPFSDHSEQAAKTPAKKGVKAPAILKPAPAMTAREGSIG